MTFPLLLRVAALLHSIEWNGRVSTDYDACPFCYALKDGFEGNEKYPAEAPLTHRPHCELHALIQECDHIVRTPAV